MFGTFRDGDCLWIFPTPFDSLQPGDVVAFDSRGKAVAHRIVDVGENSFKTQGDSNLRRDELPLTPGNYIGKVMARERAGLRSSVTDGAHGRRRAALLYGACLLRLLFYSLLKPFYRLIRISRLVRVLWHPRFTMARFACPEGYLIKFIHLGRTAACWAPHERRWICRRPYDLVLTPPTR